MTGQPVEVLERIPKRTPVWAVGIISVVVTLTASIGIIYPVMKDELKEYLRTNAALSEKRMALTSEEWTRVSELDTKSLDTVLQMVRVHSEQITNLTILNNKLSERVAELEKEVVKTKADLAVCTEALSACKR